MKTSECRDILNLIPLLIDDMLSDEEKDVVTDHLKVCKTCREEHAFLTSVLKVSGTLPEIEVPDGFHKRLMEKVGKEKTGTSFKGNIRLWKTVTSFAAAAAVIAVSVVSYLGLNVPKESQNPDAFLTPSPVYEKTEEVKPVETVKTTPSPKVAEPQQEKGETPDPLALEAYSLEAFQNDDEQTAFVVAYVTVAEDKLDEARDILKDLEKDEIGYRAENGREEFLEKLSFLEDFSVREETQDTDSDYIILEETP